MARKRKPPTEEERGLSKTFASDGDARYLEDATQQDERIIPMQHPPRNIAIDWLNTLWSTNLPSNSKLIACNLRRYMNSQNDMAWPSIPRIAGECGLSEQCVRKHLKILCADGWLQQVGKSNVETNIYQAQIPPAMVAGVQSFTSPPAMVAPELNKELNNTLSRGAKRFVAPSVEEVRAYCEERGNQVDPETFVDWNTSKGWKVGNQPMKDWKAAVRTWEKRERKNGRQLVQPATQSTRDSSLAADLKDTSWSR
jgi:hypothetical protein